MRIGSLVRLLRVGQGISLRGFASDLGIPHSSLAAIESGWVAPTPEILARLQGYADQSGLSPQLSELLVRQYVNEYTLRAVVGDVLPFPVCLAATAVLRSFMKHEAGSGASAVKEEDLFAWFVSALESTPDGHSFKMADLLPYELLRAMVLWLAQRWEPPIGSKEAWHFPLTKPSSYVRRLLGRCCSCGRSSSGETLLTIFGDDSFDYVLDPFAALDVLLLLATEVHLNLFDPGKVRVCFPLSGGIERIEVNGLPPHLAFLEGFRNSAVPPQSRPGNQA